MMRTRFVFGLAAAAVATGIFCISGPALAQPAPTIPPPMKTSGQPERAVIHLFIADRAAAIAGSDAPARGVAREALFAELGIGKPDAPSAAFTDLYLEELNAELGKILDTGSLEARLNASIVAARVATADRNGRLVPTIIKALSDKAEPVTLWGMKGASDVLPLVLDNPATKNSPLLAKASETALARLQSTVISESYDAMTLNVFGVDPTVLRQRFPDARWKPMVGSVLPELKKLWSARLTLIAKGAVTDPMAESRPLLFFDTRTWQAMTDADKAEIVQLTSDQLSLAGQHAALVNGVDKEVWVTLLSRTADQMQIFAGREGAAGQALVDAAKKAGLAAQPNAAAPAILEAVNAVLPAVQAIPKYASTRAAPKLTGDAGPKPPSPGN